jgi:hypothetical protein
LLFTALTGLARAADVTISDLDDLKAVAGTIAGGSAGTITNNANLVFGNTTITLDGSLFPSQPPITVSV